MTLWGDGGAYGAWAAYLDAWQRDLTVQTASPPSLQPEDFTSDTWSRLVARLHDALGRRLGLWSDALTAALSRADDESAVGRALTQARTGLRGVLALTDSPALPEDLRARLREVVERQIRSAQSQLEQQLDRSVQRGAPRPAVEARRRTIRDNPLDAVLTEADDPLQRTPPSVAWNTDPNARPRRILALD